MQLPVIESSSPGFVPTDTGPRSIAAVKVLRISVTDRCNYRCLYCMPAEGVPWLDKLDILSFEEICAVIKASINLHNIRRFKLTGGEPTVRHGVVELVRMIRAIPGIEDLSLTTNGQLLDDLARPLRDAGLDRVTISLDSLKPDRFAKVTRTGDLSAVLRGMDRCEEVGFHSIKINCVTMRGTNDDEIVDFAKLSVDRKLTVRFIEYMPLGDAALIKDGNPFREVQSNDGTIKFDTFKVAKDEVGPAGGCGAQDRGNVFVSETEVRDAIERTFGPLIPVDRLQEAGVGPAIPYQVNLPHTRGRIGFISAMSAPFCATCNRLRLTANGVLRSCLFEGGEVEIRSILRNSIPADRAVHLAQAMTDCVKLKPDVHSIRGNEQMSRLGG
jgi:cyclic pyranopterin phosphate synthase